MASRCLRRSADLLPSRKALAGLARKVLLSGALPGAQLVLASKDLDLLTYSYITTYSIECDDIFTSYT